MNIPISYKPDPKNDQENKGRLIVTLKEMVTWVFFLNGVQS